MWNDLAPDQGNGAVWIVAERQTKAQVAHAKHRYAWLAKPEANRSSASTSVILPTLML